MTQRFKGVAAAVLVTLAGLPAVASAQAAGSIIVRAGVTQIAPDVTSGDLTAPSFAGTKADIKADTQITAGVTYMVTDQFAVDVPLSLGFKHNIVGDGAIANVGKIGDVKALPITLLGQYRFNAANDQFRPYLGAGVTYARFYKARSTLALTALTGGTPANPTTLSVDSKWAPTVQAGVVINLAPRWSLDVALLKTFLKTRTTLSTGQTLDATLNPTTVSVGIGYSF